jgi:hypothetical protein
VRPGSFPDPSEKQLDSSRFANDIKWLAGSGGELARLNVTKVPMPEREVCLAMQMFHEIVIIFLPEPEFLNIIFCSLQSQVARSQVVTGC